MNNNLISYCSCQIIRSLFRVLGIRKFALSFNLPDTKDVIALNGGAVTDQKAKSRQKLNSKNLSNWLIMFMLATVWLLNLWRMQRPETKIFWEGLLKIAWFSFVKLYQLSLFFGGHFELLSCQRSLWMVP